MGDSNHQSGIKRLLTIRELSAELRVSPKTIYRWVNRKEVPFVKLHRHLRFELSEVIGHFKRKSSEQMKACAPSFDLLLASHQPLSTRKGARSMKTSETATLPSLRKGDQDGN